MRAESESTVASTVFAAHAEGPAGGGHESVFCLFGSEFEGVPITAVLPAVLDKGWSSKQMPPVLWKLLLSPTHGKGREKDAPSLSQGLW